MSVSAKKTSFYWLYVSMLLGVLTGITFFSLGSFWMARWLDQVSLKVSIRGKGVLQSSKKINSEEGDTTYLSIVQFFPSKPSQKAFSFVSHNKDLFDWYLIQKRDNKLSEKVPVAIAQSRIFRKWTVIRWNGSEYIEKMKSQQGIFFLGLMLFGGVLVFATLKNAYYKNRKLKFEKIV